MYYTSVILRCCGAASPGCLGAFQSELMKGSICWLTQPNQPIVAFEIDMIICHIHAKKHLNQAALNSQYQSGRGHPSCDRYFYPKIGTDTVDIPKMSSDDFSLTIIGLGKKIVGSSQLLLHII